MSWPVVKLGEVASFVRNGASIKQSSNASGLKITRIETIAERVVNLEKCGYADLSEHDYPEHRLKKGDILISHINSEKHLGKCAIFDENRDDIVHGMNLLCFRANEKVLPKYLFHFLSSGCFLIQIPKITKKSVNQASFTVTHFKDLEIPLPPLEEQKRIAAILDKADAIRQKRKQAIELADEFLRSVFLDMFGDPVTNPKGWEIKTIGELATKVTDGEHQTPKREEKGYKLLSARNVQHGFLDVENEKVDYVGEAEFQRITKRLSISKSDVLLSCSGTIGRVSMNTLNEPFCLVRSVAVIRLADNGVIPEFLVGYLGTSAMQAIMKKEANSSGQPNLFQNQIKQLKVLVPPLELQAKYKRFLDHYKEKKASLISANEQQALLFKSLSQKAFSGQL